MTTTSIALCSAVPMLATNVAPEWVHLLPAGEVRTADGRGPYHVGNVAALMSASMAGGKLPLDENHATDRAAPLGGASPARGWIVALQQRADGIWGRVHWVDPAGGVPAWKQYRGVSPVIAHDKAGRVSMLLRASLTNTPNLTGLTSLHSAGAGVPPKPSAFDPNTIAQKARALQQSLQQAGLPIDFASAVSSVMDEEASNAASDASAPTAPADLDQDVRDLQAIFQRLGMPLSASDAVALIMDGATG